MSLVYDKELKRWVNPNSKEDTSISAPPSAPPSRAQTASPTKGRRGHAPVPRLPAMTPPIPTGSAPPQMARSITHAGLSADVRRQNEGNSNELMTPLSVSSNNHTEQDSSGNTLKSQNAPPPMRQPRKQAGKRAISARYVSVE